VINGNQRLAALPKPYGTNGNGDMSLAQARFENERIQKLTKVAFILEILMHKSSKNNGIFRQLR